MNSLRLISENKMKQRIDYLEEYDRIDEKWPTNWNDKFYLAVMGELDENLQRRAALHSVCFNGSSGLFPTKTSKGYDMKRLLTFLGINPQDLEYCLSNTDEATNDLPHSTIEQLVDRFQLRGKFPWQKESVENARVICAEDEDNSKTLLRRKFSELRVVPVFARDEKEALERLARKEFDLLVTDIGILTSPHKEI